MVFFQLTRTLKMKIFVHIINFTSFKMLMANISQRKKHFLINFKLGFMEFYFIIIGRFDQIIIENFFEIKFIIIKYSIIFKVLIIIIKRIINFIIELVVIINAHYLIKPYFLY
jgi:hypothetical protein